MPKNSELTQELEQEFAKGNFKPSQLKRSKSTGDLDDKNKRLKEEPSPSPEVFYEAPEENPAELKAKISQLEDQVLELRLEKIKDFGEYLEKKKTLEGELEQTVDYGEKEITRLETKLRHLNKKKLSLEQQIFSAQSEAKKWELKAINAGSKEPVKPQSSDNHLL